MGTMMSKEYENEIRSIMREEIAIENAKKTYNLSNIRFPIGCTPVGLVFTDDLVSREGEHWSRFEKELVNEKFDEMCLGISRKIGRSKLAVACQIRRAMHSKDISTW